MLKNIVFIFVFILALFTSALAQNRSLDSVYKRYTNASSDTQKVNSLNAMFWHFNTNNSDSALKIAQQALLLSEKINFLTGKLTASNNIGVIHFYKGNYTQSLKFYLRSAALLSGLKEGEEKADVANKKLLSSTYNNIGTIFLKQRQYAMAENYFKKSIIIDLLINDKKGLANCYNNLGIKNEESGNYEEALKYYDKSLKIKKEAGDSIAIPSTLINMGVVAMNQKDYKTAKDYLESAYELAHRNNNKMDGALAIINLGDVFYEQKKYSESIGFYEKALSICQKENYLQYTSYAFQSISLAFGKLKNFEKAYAFYQRYTGVKDSIYNHENAKMLNELAAKYENENKEKEIKLLTSEKGIQYLELKKNRIMIISFTIGSILFAGFGVFVFYAYRLKRKANMALDEKNKKIEQAYAVIEDKQKEILDSIHYAKRIQASLLPNETFFEKELERLEKKK